MKNLLIVVLPAFFWATSDVLTRIFSDKINATLGTLLLSIGMVISLLLGIFFMPNLSTEISTLTWKYSLIAIFAGFINATGFFFFVKFLQQGGNFTSGLPIILVSIVIFTTIYGVVFFKDPLTIKTGIGLVLGIGAIYFLSS
jgi:drug/metabolite transporter (DMT)-like permease